jgi:hypothetical protein
MTLLELANFICRKVRQTDTNALARCKEFLRARYELIYNDALWRDSLYLFPFTFTPDTNGTPESWDSIQMMPSVVDKVVGLRRSNQEITATAQEQLIRGGIDAWAQQGDPVQFSTLAPVVAIIPDRYYFSDAGFSAVSAVDGGIAWSAVYIDTDGNRIKVTGTLHSSGIQAIGDPIRVIERATKGATSGAVTIDLGLGEEPIVTAPAASTAFPVRIPVRLFPTPTAATDFSALVKKKVLHLEDDGDTPELRNVDQALIAFAQGDMWEYGRQINKANAKFGEAGALLKQLMSLHTYQEQTLINMAPEVSQVSGDIDTGLGGKGYW